MSYRYKEQITMPESPMISVIVPVYNGGRFIDSCVEYIDAQNYDDIEICFVIDHKTTDDTVEKVKKNMDSHPCMHYCIQHEDGRPGIARNIGVDSTTGRYIWFLDVDDRPFPTFIKEMLRIMEETDSDMTFCNFYASYSYELPKIAEEYSVRTMNRLEALKFRASGGIPVTPWSMVCKRDLITNNNLRYISGIAEDVDFTYRALDASKKVSYYNKPLYLYYRNPNSICNGEDENKRAYAELDVYKELFSYFEKDQEFSEYFKDRAIISSMRCMSHFSEDEFMNNYSSGWVLETLKAMNKKKPFPEVFVFRHFPRIYHSIVKTGMERVYTNTFFDNSVSESHIKKWFKKHFQNL